MFRVRSWWNLLLVLSCLFFASDHVLAQNVSSVASPQASVNDPVQANGRSKLALSLTIPFPVVAETMGKLPLIYREVGQHESCKLSVLPNCNYTYDLTFKRGPIAIAREHGAFKVTFPVSVHGDIRVRAIKGDSLPDSLRLFSRKTAGDVSVSLLIKLAVKDNWCPTWTVQPNLVWRKKPTIDLPLWGPMDLSEDIKSRVNEAFSIVGGDGAKDTACAAVRDKVTSLWTSNSDNPIKFEFMGSTYYFNTDPQRIGLFGVQVEEQRLRLGLTVEGGSSISSSPSKVRPPLPDRIDAITTVENHLEIDARRYRSLFHSLGNS